MNKISIDPGLTGAIAWLDENDNLIEVYDMPVMTKGTGKKQQVNAVELANIIRDIKFEFACTAYVESVHSMPGQGVSSSFTFGEGTGVIRGILAALKIPVEFVAPQKWKKAAGLIGSDKDAARTKAINFYPEAELHLKKHIGRADAILIGRYGDKVS